MNNSPPTPKQIITRFRPKYSFGKTFIFRLRQHKDDNFAGLWELTLLNEDNQIEKMISDADALNFCLENMQGEIENEGF